MKWTQRIGFVSALLAVLAFANALLFVNQAAAVHPGEKRPVNYVIPEDERVYFKSGADKVGVEIFGQLFIPEGSGPFPAVVLAHGFTGMFRVNREWAERLRDLGYAALLVDSFDPRRGTNGLFVPLFLWVDDLYGALKHLGTRQDIIADKVAVLGWSYGGTSTLAALRSGGEDAVGEPSLQFAAGVAYYPSCVPYGDKYSPLLIVIGDRERESALAFCRTLVDRHKAGGNPIEFEVYENATHAFDYYLEKVHFQGGVIDRNPVATEAAIKRVQEFLERQLR